MEAHGVEAWVGVGAESTWGTGVSRTVFTEFLSESLDLKQGREAKPSLRGVSKARFVKKKKSVEGGLELQVQANGHEIFFKHILGAVATSGPVSSRYTHAFTLAKALPTGMSIEANRDSAAIGGSSSDLYVGCQVSKATFKQTAEDFLNLSLELLGKDGSFVAVSTPTFASFLGFDWEGFTFSLDTGFGYAAIDISELEISIDNGLAGDRYKLGQVARKGLGRGGHRTITGKLTKEFDSLTERNLFRNLTQGCKAKGEWTAQGDATSILTLEVLNLEWKGSDPKADTEGVLSLSMEFEARIASTEGDEFTATLVNETSSVP